MDPAPRRTRLTIAIRAIAVWLVLIVAEILHGIARGILLVPHEGEFRSNQIGVFTGSFIILGIALATVRWIGASRTTELLLVGAFLAGSDSGVRGCLRPLRGGSVVGAVGRRLQCARRRVAAVRDAGSPGSGPPSRPEIGGDLEAELQGSYRQGWEIV